MNSDTLQKIASHYYALGSSEALRSGLMEKRAYKYGPLRIDNLYSNLLGRAGALIGGVGAGTGAGYYLATKIPALEKMTARYNESIADIVRTNAIKEYLANPDNEISKVLQVKLIPHEKIPLPSVMDDLTNPDFSIPFLSAAGLGTVGGAAGGYLALNSAIKAMEKRLPMKRSIETGLGRIPLGTLPSRK